MSKSFRIYGKRTLALVLAVLCVVGFLPHTVKATDDTITLTDFGYSDAHFQSEALGSCAMNQMYFDLNGETTTGFCGTKGGGMGTSLFGQTWGNPREITDPTLKTVMAYFYANSTGEHTEKAKSMGLGIKWSNYVTWYMGAWTQAVVWRYQEGSLDPNPAEACAEELMAVLNSLDSRSFTSIDELYDGSSFRDRVQNILNMGEQGVWGECTVYEYLFTGAGSSGHPKDTVQKVVIGEREVKTETSYALTVKKVDADDPNKTLPGAMFHVESSDGSISVDGVTNTDGTYTLKNLPADTYSITETAAPEGYEIDNAGPVYALVPGSDGSTTVTVTIKDSMEITGSGHIRKVDADDPNKGLGGAVIKIEGVDNTYSGTFTTSADGSLSDVPWEDLPKGSYTAEEITPPEGYTLSTDPGKVKQAFTWDGKTDVNLVFEDDAKVKIRLIKKDESGRPLAGALFNIYCDGQLVGSDTTDAAGTITVPNVTKGLYAFVEAAAPEGYAKMTEPALTYVDQADIDGGGTITVTAVDHALLGLRILKRDSRTGNGLAGITFRVWRNTVPIGDYVTDGFGEIVLDNLQPGTYQVQEVSSDDAHVLNGTPQQVELVVGEGEKQLVFVNDPKPGMHLVKLDSKTMLPLAGAKFRISKVGGGFTQEYTTDASGEIDLSNLDPGAYEVEEIAAPEGYLLESAKRVVQLNAGENAEFVFTDTRRPVLEIEKYDAETGSPLAGVTFRISSAEDSEHYTDRTTDAQGRITLDDLDAGLYTVREISTPAGYILDSTEHRIKLYPGETSRLVVQNQRKPGLVIEKRSKKDGSALAGATFRIEEIGDAEHYFHKTTDSQGRITLEGLEAGVYSVREIAAPEGYILDSTEHRIKLDPGEISTIVIENEKRPALRIVKYDAQTKKPLSDTTFEVYRDSELIGTYTTDASGEILLYDLEPGTYLVKEVATPDSHVVNSTPQEIELVSEQTGTLVFLNYLKPGMRLVKLDSETMMPLAGAKFRISKIGGDFSKEYTTDGSGEIDLSELEPGAYEVVEISAPDGYLIDDARRVIELVAGENAEFVFTDTKRPTLVVEKLDAHDGKPLAGATFRIVPINDPDHYVDKVTDAEGRITLEGLDAGVYSVQELIAPEGYVLNSTEHHVKLYPGETSTLIVENEKRPALRIVKYDAQTKAPLKGTTFEVYRDSELIGTYTTDTNGEILLYDLIPGTYLVKEIAAPDTHVVNSTPQEIELVPEQTSTLVFLNYIKPGIHLVKLDSQTMKPLAGAKFRISKIGGDFAKEYTTDASGEIDLSELDPGAYEVVETQAPDGYLIDDARRVIELVPGENAEFVFTDTKRPTLVVEKHDAHDGKPLAGATFRIAPVDDPDHYVDKVTDTQGRITLEGLDAGVYSVWELNAPEGYVLDSTEYHVKLYPGETSTIVIENEKRPTLRIVKYDAQTKKPLPDTTFEVYRDSKLIGTYTTDANGEILLYDLEPGTYLVKEVSAPDTHVVNSTPQEIELVPEQTSTLVFLNYIKPGIHLVKLDSQTFEPLANARFRITQVGGGYSEEHITDINGEIDLSGLEPGSYSVEELAAPDGYLIDDAQRIIRIEGGEYAEFVFTDTKRPTLVVEKYDAHDGKPLAGATFRIAPINDPDHYVDKVTDAQGRITLEGLDSGVYSVQELNAPEGYVLNSTEHHVKLYPGETSTIIVENEKRPALRIVKYDAQTKKPLPDTTFEVYRDSELIGTYTTDANGEILLYDLTPGTYLVKEVSAPDTHVVNSTPQEIELVPEQTSTLVFLNYLKPGIHLVKLDSETMEPLAGAKFRISQVGGNFSKEFTTDANGEIDLSGLEPGSYTVEELAAPDGYLIDDAKRIIKIEGGEYAQFVFTDTRRPSFKLVKLDSLTGNRLAGATFRIAKVADGAHYLDRVTDTNGEIVIDDLEPGIYSVLEMTAPEGYVRNPLEYHVELVPGREAQLVVSNAQKPNLIIIKRDADTGEPVPNTVFLVEAADGHSVDEVKTDKDGRAILENLLPGVYNISEKSVPSPYLLDAESQLVTLYANRDHTVYFENHKKPTLTVNKIDSVTGSPIEGAKFEVWYGSNSTATGELNNFGTFYSDENGQFFLDELRDGWYRVTEVEPAAGYTMKEPSTQEFYIRGGESKTVTFENTPKNAIIVEKYDSVTGEALAGCIFQLRYLGGTSGTGGTVIGTKVTGKNGVAMWTGLNPGTYIVEEIDPADGYNIIQSSETILLADNGEQSVVTVRFLNSPDGMLLVRKVCSVNPSVTLAGAEFKISYADGTLIGDNNGLFVTDEKGEIRVTGLKPGKSVIVTETRAPAGFIIDSQSQTVQIKEGRVVSLTFRNQPKGAIVVKKVDSATGKPLSGAEFRITTAAGCEVGLNGVIGSSTLTQNGIFTTDANGEIKVSNLAPGTYVLTELKAPDGYVMDAASTNVVIGSGGDTQIVTVKNSKAGTLIVDKRDSRTGKPLEGVQFRITTASGEFVPDENGRLSSNGMYFTNKDGQIVLHGVVGTLVVTETVALPGYTMDNRPQTVVVTPNNTQTVYFTNTPSTTLVIEKYIEGTMTPLKGVTFLVTDSSGAVVGKSNGEYITDENGRIVIEDLTPGTTVTAKEVKVPDGFVLDTIPKSILIKEGEIQTLRFYNKAKGTLVIQKKDSVTGALLSGAKFQLTYADGSDVNYDNGHMSSKGLYTTDENGEIRVYGVVGTIEAKELEAAPGYVIDPKTQTQTVTVNAEDTQTLVFRNEPLVSLTITKLDSQTHKPVPNTEFTVTDSNGNLIGRYVTGEDGTVTVTGLIPGTTLIVRESGVPKGYVLDPTPKVITVKNGSNSVSTGAGNDLVFENDPTVSLVIEKYIDGTTTPLQGVTFLVTDSSGKVIGGSNGEFITDEYGRIVIRDLEPGTTVVAREVRTVDGYVLDTTPKTIEIKAGEAQTLRFYNKRTGALVVQKKDKQTGEPLAGVEFEITYSDGSYVDADCGHLSSKGLYKTDANGEIRIPGVVGTVVVTETNPLEGYVMDEGTRSQTVVVNPGDTQTIVVYNTKMSGLTIIKKDADTGARIKGVQFEVRKANGEIIGHYTTDTNGTVYLSNLASGWYEVIETSAASGYKLDSTPHRVEVKDGGTPPLEITNRRISGITVHKTDSATGEGIYGVVFMVYDNNKKPVEQIVTDQNGYAYTDTALEVGKYYVRELEAAEGYLEDKEYKTIFVKSGENVIIEWKNTAVTGQIQITKTSADYNSNNGWAAGTPIPGTEFEIYNRAGNLVDTVRTDKNGVAKTRPLPLGRYTIIESKAASYYSLDKTPIEVEIEFAGQIVRAAMTNKSLLTNVSITKRGYSEVMPGQTIRYDFSGIANNSTVSLESFYWRDTLPTGAVRLEKIVTGTWSAQGNYKIVYKTNLSQEYRLLADNLSTARSYTLAASPVALGLANNEYVTEFMYVFGIVPAGFRQVEAPKVYCTVLPNLVNGVQFTNVADVGGVYNGQWVMAVDRWVTTVYAPTDPTPLPRTGY